MEEWLFKIYLSQALKTIIFYHTCVLWLLFFKGRVFWNFFFSYITKVHIVKVMVFPVVTCSSERWTITKAECQRIDAFQLWCWRRLWRVPWTTRRSNQSILKEIIPEYSLEGLMLKLQHFGHLMWIADSLEKSLIWEILRAEGEEGIRGWDGCMASLMQWKWTWANFRRWWGTGRPSVL